MHALLGENGAGKSTLMSILYGLYTADAGEILINGKPVEIDSPKHAIELGIGMVHQHFMLIPVMTVTENIVLANEPRRAGVFIDDDGGRGARRAKLARSVEVRRRSARARRRTSRSASSSASRS